MDKIWQEKYPDKNITKEDKTIYFLRQLIFPLLLTLALSAIAQEKSDSTQKFTPAAFSKAAFAGGCFWCMQPVYDHVEGVIETTVGYIGGHTDNPTYETYAMPSADGTSYTEAIQITFDPDKVSYEALLNLFWHNIDPLSPPEAGQFCDVGYQYRSEIFYYNEAQKKLAEQSKVALEQSSRFDKPIETRITAATKFYKAEAYHQKYSIKNPLRYKLYRYNCGRDRTLKARWG
ncbi:MAG: peptide-methionine (S)-S-oxide reductase MsrA [Gammaproteobacteria bacterium]